MREGAEREGGHGEREGGRRERGRAGKQGCREEGGWASNSSEIVVKATLEVTQCGGVDIQLPLEIRGRAGAEKEGKQGRVQREGADKAGCREGPYSRKRGEDEEDASAESSPKNGAQFCRSVWVQRRRAGGRATPVKSW